MKIATFSLTAALLALSMPLGVRSDRCTVDMVASIESNPALEEVCQAKGSDIIATADIASSPFCQLEACRENMLELADDLEDCTTASGMTYLQTLEQLVAECAPDGAASVYPGATTALLAAAALTFALHLEAAV